MQKYQTENRSEACFFMFRVNAPFPVVDQSGQCGHTYLVFSDRFRRGTTGSGTGAAAERAGFL